MKSDFKHFLTVYNLIFDGENQQNSTTDKYILNERILFL